MELRRQILTGIAGAAILIIMTLADLLWNISAADSRIVWLLRLPRTVTALVAGAALSVSGIQMQSIFRNPLADPHIMGISAGAALGAAAATLAGVGGISIVMSSCAGAILSAAVILIASGRFRNASTLLIFGVMSGFIANAGVTALQVSTDAESLKMFYSWSAGSFSNSTWTDILIMTAALACGTTIAMTGHKGLDISLFGDDLALLAGINIRTVRLRSLASCCLMTGAITAFCGPIGFIGIIAPHIAKGLFRTSRHIRMIPASLLVGCIIAVGADLLSQISPMTLPVSSTMALVGIPVVIYILAKNTSAA